MSIFYLLLRTRLYAIADLFMKLVGNIIASSQLKLTEEQFFLNNKKRDSTHADPLFMFTILNFKARFIFQFTCS